ncbi:hypothetical protein FA04_14760 [Ensifer adhaerens]|uniref:Uncharacterized protein n=1 Tax=Ensifer adhaerens TaxID=106592 RepID=A0ABY8HDE1_ENSAD|nr:hypothetical protein [Ensifer adhaerens]ANK73770.1 hypothetical protein FA04_14760 [Ensifer adhaerens]KDP70266.1 hypothetical protein FA04_28935 [Ensifer adhaerens]WFP89858.1 hypothetical protein P4B07_14990 [Ensifer adhaerens]
MSDLIKALQYEGERRVNEKEAEFGNSKSRADRVADDICHQAASRIEQLERELAAMKQTFEFVVRQAWREDPPHANHKLTDTERLSAIKFYPRIKAARQEQR